MTIAQKVHFKVDFEGMTQHIRDLWSEGSYWKCVDTIDAMGVPREYFADVIEGRAALAQDPNGREGVDGHLVKDDWQPILANCHWHRYPKYEELSSLMSLPQKWAERYLDVAYMEVGKLWREYTQTRYNGARLYEIIELLRTYPEEVLQLAGVDMTTFKYEAAYNPIAQKFGIDLDKYIEHELELDKRPKPTPDMNFSHPTGAIAPNGKFYTCGWMEHSWLVYKVAKHTIEQARMVGWIMITHPLGLPTEFKILYGDKEPNQKQLDTLFDWQQKYGEAEIINPAGEW